MCGIAGLWSTQENAVALRQVGENMLQTMRHRGPNAAQVWYDAEDNIMFAHSRLSVIDTSTAGDQPMKTQNNRYHLVFNGEIYNYQEIKQTHLNDVTLNSRSDTEVLLNLLAKYPIQQVLEVIRGMFSFALWDSREKTLTLARDPFGKKPLFYVNLPNMLAFASEPKTLLELPEASSEIDPDALSQFFLYEYVPAPASAYKDIIQVPMGSYLVYEEGSVTTSTYWEPRFHPKSFSDEAQSARKLDDLLSQAVERRLIADVPVGLFLSGGLDSSTIGWYISQAHHTPSPLHSLSTSFHDASFDESGWAIQIADHLGFTHHNVKFDSEDVLPTLRKILPFLDIPFADASLLPTCHLSQAASQHVTVVLDGDGSDELLYGYGTFQAARAAQIISHAPKSLLAITRNLIERLPVSHSYFSMDFKLKSFMRGIGYTPALRNQIWLGSFSDKELAHLLHPQYHDRIKYIYQPVLSLSSDTPSLLEDEISNLTIHHYLHNDILVKLDRATMINSLEARTPFLDIDLANFILKLPPKLKRNKYLLKKVMRGRLPDEVIDRPKKGFGIPIGKWLISELYPWAESVLAPDKIKHDGLLQYNYVQTLLTEHRKIKKDHRKKLWTIIMFQLWYDYWIKKRDIGSIIM